ncbi:MAG: hypothetical protein K0Q55_1939 [Verrucomicrobia bacterium]|jgi:hypothetical protein|nr:hypothetical protein [Verrucomicrobiota bacterium]
MIAIELNSDSTVGELRELLGKARNPQGMLRAVAKRGEGELKAHFRGRDAKSANKRGGQRTNFWAQVEKTVVGEVDEAGGMVSLGVSHPAFAQKLYGGVIRAKSARALTIPVTAEAYGKTTAEFEAATGLRLFLIKPNETGLLATRLKGAEGITVQYVLKASVNQEADPEALPDMERLGEVVMEEAERFLNEQ